MYVVAAEGELQWLKRPAKDLLVDDTSSNFWPCHVHVGWRWRLCRDELRSLEVVVIVAPTAA
jgi:hypothetical protein